MTWSTRTQEPVISAPRGAFPENGRGFLVRSVEGIEPAVLGTIDRAGWCQRVERAFSSLYIAGPHVALYRLLVGKDQNLDQL